MARQSTSISHDAVVQEITAQIAAARSVAPREIAQALTPDDGDWRRLLPKIRQVAASLEADGRLVFVRKKKRVSPEGLRGVYRLAGPEAFK